MSSSPKNRRSRRAAENRNTRTNTRTNSNTSSPDRQRFAYGLKGEIHRNERIHPDLIVPLIGEIGQMFFNHSIGREVEHKDNRMMLVGQPEGAEYDILVRHVKWDVDIAFRRFTAEVATLDAVFLLGNLAFVIETGRTEFELEGEVLQMLGVRARPVSIDSQASAQEIMMREVRKKMYAWGA